MADFFGVELATQFGDAVVGGEGEGFVEVEEAVHGVWGVRCCSSCHIKKPINVRIQSTAGTVIMWFLPILTGGMGILFLAIAAAIYFPSRQKAG
jgi:hypothetical protein